MVSLTIQQRDLLRELLDTDSPVVVADIAHQLNLTPRQVSYRLKPVKSWLAQHNVNLKSTPGVGLELTCSSKQRLHLLRELDAQSNFDLTLTAGQRQQLFTLNFLTATEPLIINWLQHVADVSRTTVLKDLEPVESWLQRFELTLIRRPNYGLSLEGAELAQRQALTALLWNDNPFGEPLTRMTHDRGLVFALSDEAALPIVQQSIKLLNRWNTRAALEWVAYAEAQFGGRFTDDAVLHLALTFAIQAFRVSARRDVECDAGTLAWLAKQRVWSVATEVATCMWPDVEQGKVAAEIAIIAMHLLAGLRNHRWPGDLDIDPTLTELVTILMKEVALAFNTPGLRHDTSLRDGLVSHVIPAVMRQRFGLWAPPSWSDGTLSRQYQREDAIARELALVVTEQTGVVLPEGEIDTLILLLRAAFIRERPHHPKRAFIVCPSGMATAQLLVARLKTRFPNLEIAGVLSMRELSPKRVAGAQMLISTVPLENIPSGLRIIQVHPLLLPEDIERITHWLT